MSRFFAIFLLKIKQACGSGGVRKVVQNYSDRDEAEKNTSQSVLWGIMISEQKNVICSGLERLGDLIQEEKQRFILPLKSLTRPQVEHLNLTYLVISS